MDYLTGVKEFSDRTKHPWPQVILLDLKMPRVNGFEFLQWLRADSPGDLRLLPVIVMSSSNQKNDVNRAYALGANSYFVKPISWRDFETRMKALNAYWGSYVEKPDVTS